MKPAETVFMLHDMIVVVTVCHFFLKCLFETLKEENDQNQSVDKLFF